MNEEKQKLFDLLEEEQTKGNAVPSSTASTDGRENKDVLKFIRKLNIQPGPNKVPTYMIYYQFAQWHQTQWRNLWGKEEFFRTFKKHFEQKRSGNQRFYMINDALDFIPTFLINLTAFMVCFIVIPFFIRSNNL